MNPSAQPPFPARSSPAGPCTLRAPSNSKREGLDWAGRAEQRSDAYAIAPSSRPLPAVPFIRRDREKLRLHLERIIAIRVATTLCGTGLRTAVSIRQTMLLGVQNVCGSRRGLAFLVPPCIGVAVVIGRIASVLAPLDSGFSNRLGPAHSARGSVHPSRNQHLSPLRQ